MDPGATCPESSSINTTDCLLRAVLHTLQQLQEKDAKEDFNWDPLSFVVTVVIGVVALLFAATTIFQGVLTTSPGRRKCSYEAIGPWSSLTRRRWNLSELRRDSIAYTPLITAHVLRLSLEYTHEWGIPQLEQGGGHGANFSRFLGIKHSGSSSHCPSPQEGFRSTWMRLIHPLGLDISLWLAYSANRSSKIKFWSDEQSTAADYLPNEIQAIPAFLDINSITILAAMAGCNKLTMDPDLNYPIFTGPKVQLRFRRDPSLGIVGTFETYKQTTSHTEDSWDFLNLHTMVRFFAERQEDQYENGKLLFDLLDPNTSVQGPDGCVVIPLVFPVTECITRIMTYIAVMTVQTPTWLHCFRELQSVQDHAKSLDWKTLTILLKIWDEKGHDTLQFTQALAKLAVDITVHKSKNCSCFRCRIKDDLQKTEAWMSASDPRPSAEDNFFCFTGVDSIGINLLVGTLLKLECLGTILNRHSSDSRAYKSKGIIGAGHTQQVIRICYDVDRFFKMVDVDAVDDWLEHRHQNSSLVYDVLALFPYDARQTLWDVRLFAKRVLEVVETNQRPNWNLTNLGDLSLAKIRPVRFFQCQNEPEKHILLYQAILRASLFLSALDNTEIRAAGIGRHIVPFL